MKPLTRALVVEIKYLIPLNGSNINDSLLLSSDKTFKDFKSAVADILGIPPKEVQVAYKFNTQPKADGYTLIKDAVQYLELIQSVRDEIAGFDKKKSKSKPKEFIVLLKNVNEGKEKGKQTSGKKEKNQKRIRI